MYNFSSAQYEETQRRENPIPIDEIPSDVDSEGDPPPTDVQFVDPMNLEDAIQAPPRNAEVRLPHFQPKDRPRLREMFEARVSYEEWVDGELGPRTGGTAGMRAKREVKRLEDDSDLPVGKSYFWHAFCRSCGITYHPHVPGQWACPVCRNKVWQQPDDPESSSCAICKRGVATIREVKGHKIRNPMARNSHICKRCGKIVCDNCYNSTAVNVEEFGYNEPQKVCKKCEKDMIIKPPEEEDLGTLHDEDVGQTEETGFYLPYFTPKCRSCNITFGKPPKRWQCPSCGQPVWQPDSQADKCWICRAPMPKVRCHKCGQHACSSCGAYSQPLPELGFDDGVGRSVCRACYGGVSLRPSKVESSIEDSLKPIAWKAKCPVGTKTYGAPPKEWNCDCHRRKTWQPADHPQSSKCAVCTVAQTPETSANCGVCGRLACLACTQYSQPCPERGFAKGQAMVICKACFNPKHSLRPDHTDFPFWPPKCDRCQRTWTQPPDRWKCTTCQELVWQPSRKDALIVSHSCFTCGKKLVAGAVNCRSCGRVVCSTCGANRAECVERGFVRGQNYQVCIVCFKKKPESQKLADAKAGAGKAGASATAPASKSPAPASKSPQPGGKSPGPAAATRTPPQQQGPLKLAQLKGAEKDAAAARIKKFYEDYNPTQMEKAAKAMTYDMTEKELMDQLRAKYPNKVAK